MEKAQTTHEATLAGRLWMISRSRDELIEILDYIGERATVNYQAVVLNRSSIRKLLQHVFLWMDWLDAQQAITYWMHLHRDRVYEDVNGEWKVRPYDPANLI